MTGKYMKQKGIIEKVVSVNKSCVGIKLFGYGTYYVKISSIKKWRGSKSNGQKFYYNILRILILKISIMFLLLYLI